MRFPSAPRPASTSDIPALNLGPGSYSVTVALHSDVTHLEDNYDWWDKALVFEVVRGPETFFVGVAHLPGVEAQGVGAVHENRTGGAERGALHAGRRGDACGGD